MICDLSLLPILMSSRKRLLLGVVGLGCAATGGAYVWAQPTYSSLPSHHDKITPQQCRLVRTVPDGRPVTPEQNPGARIFENFLPNCEPLLQELQSIKRDYGINLIQPIHAAIYRWQMSYMRRAPPVNMLRVTGRPEDEQQRRPWGYGDTLDESTLPPEIKAVADRIRKIPGLRLGRLRDVTINWRHSGFLRLDPHLDPAGDGENVFILSVDAPAVLTLSPHNWYKMTRWLSMLTLVDERDQVRQEAEHSWTSYDIDVLLPPGSLLHLSGDVRWKWTHGTRLGLEPVADLEGAAGAAGWWNGRGAGGRGLMHWFGRPDNLIGPTSERHSVVFAFGEPESE